MYQVLLAVIVVTLAVLVTSYGSRTTATPGSASFNLPVEVNKTEPILDAFEVVEIPERGKGMVAIRDIKVCFLHKGVYLDEVLIENLTSA